MTSPIKVWILRLSFLVSVAAWFFTVLYVDPEAGSLFAQFAFYGFLFLWLSSLTMLVLWETSHLLRHGKNTEARPAFRQGLLVGVLGVVLLGLQQERLLTWWSGALIVVAMLLLELQWRAKRSDKQVAPPRSGLV